MAKKQKRLVVRVSPAKAPGQPAGWAIKRGAVTWDVYDRKSDAVSEARDLAKAELARGGLAQLVVHGRNGKIQEERTYGKDPRRSKG